MTDVQTLDADLEAFATDPLRQAAARAVLAIAAAGLEIAALIARGPLAGDLAAARGTNLGGDGQKALDVISNDLVRDALARAGVAVFGSEEEDQPLLLDRAGLVAVATDPLDGSSNIDTNLSVGTIFAVLPHAAGAEPLASLLQPGSRQLAGGFVVYGPQTAMVLSLGEGTFVYVVDRASGRWLKAQRLAIPASAKEYAINASNARHWTPEIAAYIGDLNAGIEGPRAKDYNMRWLASLVADCYRILVRGGIYLYPGDAREGYAAGRLRLVYEANPIALVVEQAGGLATDGRRRILDLTPEKLHQRTPFVFGSREEVEAVREHHEAPHAGSTRPPLFAKRGLFLA